VVCYMKETVYYTLFFCVIRGRWRQKLVSSHRSVTCETVKEYERNEWKLTTQKLI
jgi:hypothetical protein